ncbi:cell division site-positioning protein MapZ family protein [Enterococcus ratti]|uniref:cell division site-positioning protein MapZ family protein n=1 Tax=Enterococcus ratti TaxID=150033 RepID=UPI0035199AE9
MIKKCPTCGSEKIQGELICPDCGHQIQEDDQHTSEEKKNLDQMDSSKEVFPDTELNDPIEWSELTDLPLESVMELFKEDSTVNEEQKTDQKSISETNTIANQKHVSKIEETNLKESVEAPPENEIKTKQQKQVADLKEFVDQENENSILSAYIKAHREDTTEEHAEELMRMIKEELVSKASKETHSQQIKLAVNRTESNSEQEKKVGSKARRDLLKPSSQVDKDTRSNKTEKLVEPNDTVESTDKKRNSLTKESQIKIEEAENFSSVERKSEKAAPILEKDYSQMDSKKFSDEASCGGNLSSEEEHSGEPNNDLLMKETKPAEYIASEILPKKSKKGLYITLGVALLFGLGGWAYYDHYQNVQAQIAAQEEAQKRKVTKLSQALAAFYTDDSRQFIYTSMINQDLSKLRISLNEVKKAKEYTELVKIYQDIQTKIKEIQRINELFTAPVILDDHLAKEPKLKEDRKVQSMTTVDTAFGQLIKQAEEEADKQYKQLQVAKEKLKTIYNNKADNVTRKQYDEVKNEVAKVKNEKLAVSLNDSLKKVEEQLTAKEKKEAQQKEEARKAKKAVEEARKKEEAVQQADAQILQQTRTPSTVNSGNQPILSTRESDVSDTGNPAWNWALGVKQRVIDTCIQRGYIIEGGYTLEKARIENGEGYYNLYATSTKSALMNGIGESALPFYIVTINCKTGWFAGNGSQ